MSENMLNILLGIMIVLTCAVIITGIGVGVYSEIQENNLIHETKTKLLSQEKSYEGALNKSILSGKEVVIRTRSEYSYRGIFVKSDEDTVTIFILQPLRYVCEEMNLRKSDIESELVLKDQLPLPEGRGF